MVLSPVSRVMSQLGILLKCITHTNCPFTAFSVRSASKSLTAHCSDTPVSDDQLLIW